MDWTVQLGHHLARLLLQDVCILDSLKLVEELRSQSAVEVVSQSSADITHLGDHVLSIIILFGLFNVSTVVIDQVINGVSAGNVDKLPLSVNIIKVVN